MSRSPTLPALAAAAVTVCLWASAFVGIRSAGDELSAAALALAGGALCLVGVAVTRAQRSPVRGMRTSTAPAGGSSPGA